jgi:hypothetical protein
MARDIEEFLRRAAERRQQQKQGGAAVPVPPQAPAPQAPQSPILEKSPRKQYRPVVNEPIIENVEIVEEKKVSKRKPEKRESISEHVEKYLDTSEMKQKAKNLGGQVVKVSQEFDRTVKQHLNKDICSVDDGRASINSQDQTTSDSAAARLKTMLVRPETIIQAILISEILNRPSFEDD